ncbi:MAG: folylpolyglutamate synthase/dihydrofolate synthase family protein [Deinococcales bacterium]
MADSLLAWLFARQRFLNPTLERTRSLLDLLDNPQRHFQTVLVGGTNGKGSTASSLAHCFWATQGRQKRSCALFTSPHLSYFAERFVIDGQMLPDEAIFEGLSLLQAKSEEIGASFFEIVTALACYLFAKYKVDTAIMEVGLGGRFDATNALEPVLSIITNVDLDHTKILGESVGEIAWDKAHIIRRQVLTAAHGEALRVIQAFASQRHADMLSLEDMPLVLQDLGWQGIIIQLSNRYGSLQVHSPLIGLYQAKNVALAVIAAQLLGIAEGDIQRGIKASRWPGRMEVIPYENRRFLLDAAHNPAGSAALAEALKQLGEKDKLMLFGMSADKDLANTIAPLASIAKKVILSQASYSPRAANPGVLSQYWPCELEAIPELKAAIKRIIELSKPQELIVVAGSLYLLGEVRPILLGTPAETWPRWQ